MHIGSKSACLLELTMLKCDGQATGQVVTSYAFFLVGLLPHILTNEENLSGIVSDRELHLYFEATASFRVHQSPCHCKTPLTTYKELTGIKTSARSQFCLRNENG